MARLGEKIKNAQKYQNSTGNWSSQKVRKGSDDRCPGCQVKYKDMSPKKFTAHEKKNFRECPDD